MKARIANSLSARYGGGRPPRRTYTRERTTRGTQPREEKKTAGEVKKKTGEENGKKAGVLLAKDGRKEGKEDEFRKKVHKFSFLRRLIPRKRNFFSQKLRIFKTKSLPLRLIKHNFPFLPAALRRPYSAKSRGNPDESAQMLFDLLKKIPILRRVGSIGKRIGRNVATIRSGRKLDESRNFGQPVGYVGTERAVAVTHGSVEQKSTVGK